MAKKRKCDCWLDVGKCYCGVKPDKKVNYRDRSYWKEKDILDKKVIMSYSIKRKVVLEFENVCHDLGLADNLSLVVEGLIEDFINNVRGVDLKVDL